MTAEKKVQLKELQKLFKLAVNAQSILIKKNENSLGELCEKELRQSLCSKSVGKTYRIK